jgi:hypothetical protein
MQNLGEINARSKNMGDFHDKTAHRRFSAISLCQRPRLH